ncbi:MAG: hypothetical protein CNE95_03020 [Puniceicoccaceae bacterium MED-G30]|nr:MAG: hypothetical protein CNE95_03020 [Puniceicoccaceae bacterium MED-G30]
MQITTFLILVCPVEAVLIRRTEDKQQTKILPDMKNKIVIASAFVAASSLATAEIIINDFLSFEGFVDMSYSHTDNDVSGSTDSDNSFGVDQVEINWLFNFDKVSGVIDFAYTGSDASDTPVGSGDETQLEQAYVTYSLEDGTAITAGRFESMLGFEAFEPTGLYQYSLAYDFSFLPGYSEGVKYTYESSDFFFGASLLSSYDNTVGRLGGSNRALSNDPNDALDSDYAVELAASYLLDNITFFLGGYYTDVNSNEADNDGSITAMNAYVTYETGTWLFAGELNAGNNEQGATDTDLYSGLLMANYAYSEVASVTGRVSYESSDADTLELSQTKLTLAHGYAFTDNLFLVTEVSVVDGEIDTAGVETDSESLAGAVELIFAF